MKYLLDTSTLLWWSEDSKRLDERFGEIIKNGNNIILVSVASIWEVVIKTKIKKLSISFDVEDIPKKYGFIVLNIDLDHVLELQKLRDIHKDPFDRILIAQALVEGCELLTTDKKIKKYFK